MILIRRIVLLLPTLMLSACAVTPAAALETGQQFGQWSVQCTSPDDDGRKACHLFQNLVRGDGEESQRILYVAVGYQSKDEHPIAVLRMPLGIWLPEGVVLRVDRGETRQVPVQTCDKSGCRTVVALKPELLDEMKAGDELEIVLHNSKGEPVSIPISLSGFKRGVETLSAARG